MKLDLDLNKKYLLGLSMGSDSLSLFYLLKNQGYDFCVAHVNYSRLNKKEVLSINQNFDIEK